MQGEGCCTPPPGSSHSVSPDVSLPRGDTRGKAPQGDKREGGARGKEHSAWLASQRLVAGGTGPQTGCVCVCVCVCVCACVQNSGRRMTSVYICVCVSA